MVKSPIMVIVNVIPGTAIIIYPANMIRIPDRITNLYFLVASASIPPRSASAYILK